MITVYSKEDCQQCKATDRFLDNKGIKYREIDIESDRAALTFIKGFGYLQAPVVLVDFNHPTMGGVHWSGFRPDLLAKL